MPVITQLQRARPDESNEKLSNIRPPQSRSSPKIKGTQSPVEMENTKLKQMSTLFGQFDESLGHKKQESIILQSQPKQGSFMINPRVIKAKKFSNPVQVQNNADLAQTMYNILPPDFGHNE